MVQGKEKSMAEKRQILMELRKGTPIRRISRELRVHRDIIRTMMYVAISQKWLEPNAPMPTEGEIALVIQSNHRPIHVLDAHIDKIKMWRQENYSAIVIQRMLKEYYNCPVQIGAVRRYIRRHCRVLPEPVMVRPTISGKTMEVDFGFLGQLFDPMARKTRKAWIFSARLRHSRMAYRRIVLKQDTATFLMCHVYAFEHFGGVPEEVVLDNLKAGVIQSCVDNDMLNRSYQELAEYYGFRINPCLPRTPEHKGGVENDIKYAKRNFWPQIRENIKINPEYTFQQAQEALVYWNTEVACKRIIGGLKRSPVEIFESEEKYSLKKLPEVRWENVSWIQSTVGRDWRVMHEGSYYTVPYMLIGQTVQCRITYQFFEVYFESGIVAKHPIATFKGEFLRNADHAPPFKEAVLNCSREGLLENASEIGVYVRELCEQILSDQYVDKLRPVRKILTLALSYEKERLNGACKRALEFKIYSYRSLKNILDQGLDAEFTSKIVKVEPHIFRFARDPKQYGCTN